MRRKWNGLRVVGDEYGQEGKQVCEAAQEEGGDVRDE